MNFSDIATLFNIIAAVVTTRIWGWPGALAYIFTFALLIVFWK